MKNTTYTVIIAIALVAFGCKSRKQNPATSDTAPVEEVSKQESIQEEVFETEDMQSQRMAAEILISYTKTPCFGVCPAFSFTVFRY